MTYEASLLSMKSAVMTWHVRRSITRNYVAAGHHILAEMAYCSESGDILEKNQIWKKSVTFRLTTAVEIRYRGKACGSTRRKKEWRKPFCEVTENLWAKNREVVTGSEKKRKAASGNYWLMAIYFHDMKVQCQMPM